MLAFDTTNSFQTDWQGVGANYEGFAAFPELSLSGAQQAAEFARADLSGIKMVRTWLGQDWAYPNWPSLTGGPLWTGTKMTAFYTWLTAMQTAGIKVIVNTGWSFPDDVCSISTPFPGGGTPTPTQEANWAHWVSDVLNQLINVQGFTNVIGCCFFTEPDQVTGSIPGGYTAQSYYDHLVTIALAQIVSDDSGRTPIRPRIIAIGPNENPGISTNNSWTQYMHTNDPTALDVYSSHAYWPSVNYPPLGMTAPAGIDYASWISLIQTWQTNVGSAKPLYVDEGNVRPNDQTDANGYRATPDWGWQFARMIDGHMQSGAKASLMWMLQDQVWVGSSPYSQNFGVCAYIGTGNAVYPAWYSFSLLANLTGGGGGTRLYRTTNGTNHLHGTAAFIPFGVKRTQNPAGEYSFVVINEGDGKNITLNLGSGVASPRTFYRYVYNGTQTPPPASNPAYLIRHDQQYNFVTSLIPANFVPGQSLIIYSTINLAGIGP